MNLLKTMKKKDLIKKDKNEKLKYIYAAVSGGMAVICIVILSCLYKFRFEINDDVMINDIISGRYTGDFEAERIQLLYPLGVIFSLLYKVIPAVPWFGITLIFSTLILFWVILREILRLNKKIYSKIFVLIFAAAAFLAVTFPHLVIYQYTYSSAAFLSAGLFLLLSGRYAEENTAPENDVSLKNIFRLDNIIAIILFFVSFCLREEMFLLGSPFILLTFLFRYIFSLKELSFSAKNSGKNELSKKYRLWVFLKYSALLLCTALVILFAFILHKVSVSSAEWEKFSNFFDKRTELYDYRSFPAYEENKSFFDEIGISEEEYTLILNYNYGLSDSIDADTFSRIADYSYRLKKESSTSLAYELLSYVKLYIHRLVDFDFPDEHVASGTDSPYNLIIILMYMAVFFIAFGGGTAAGLFLLFCCRSVLWLYMISTLRTPVRVMHSLYLIEFTLLMGVFIYTYGRNNAPGFKMKLAGAFAAAILTVSLVYIPNSARITKLQEISDEGVSSPVRKLYEHIENDRGGYYFLSVFSWVQYRESIFGGQNARIANHDIMGGWNIFSPFYTKKMEKFGFDDMFSALLEPKVYFVEKTAADTAWLVDYYRKRGVEISLKKREEVSDFTIYDVEK